MNTKFIVVLEWGNTFMSTLLQLLKESTNYNDYKSESSCSYEPQLLYKMTCLQTLVC